MSLFQRPWLHFHAALHPIFVQLQETSLGKAADLVFPQCKSHEEEELGVLLVYLVLHVLLD